MKKILSYVVSGAVAMMCVTGVAQAQVKDQAFKDWTVYTTTLQDKKTCYIASFPSSKTGNYKLRDEPYMLVTSVDKKTDEVSVSSGYAYMDNADVTLDLDGQKFRLFTKGELAWAKDSKTDSQIVQKMKAGKKLVVRGSSQKGSYSVDQYSLSGFTSAYKRMKDVCK